MDSDYAHAYAGLYLRHWWWRAREDYLVRILREELPCRTGNTILDVGCGGGLFFKRLSEFGEVDGVETDTSMKTGREEIDGRIHWGMLDTYRTDKRYDVILFLDVLEHVNNPEDLLQGGVRLLKTNGIVVATVPAFRALWTSHDQMNDHLERYTKSRLERVARSAGLRAYRMRYFYHWLCLAKLLVRAREALGSTSAKLPKVPPMPINRFLYLLSRAEQVLYMDRLLPIGSSLLFIGTRIDER
jgi:SAM-dependent methyltransferase